MSQQFNQYNRPPHGAPQGQPGNDFEGLSRSLLYPSPSTPIQQHNPQAWLGTPSWQSYGQDSNKNYGLPYQGQMVENGGYLPTTQQEFLPYDEGEDFYDNEDEDSAIVMGQDVGTSSQAGEVPGFDGLNRSRQQIQASLQNPTGSPKSVTPASNAKAQPQIQNVSSDSVPPKPEATAHIDRAAELRAKLLATKRGSTPGTPSASTKKSTEPVKVRNDIADQAVKHTNGKKMPASKDSKALEIRVVPFQTTSKTDAKSSEKPQASSSEPINTSTDIDGLFAQARAANAAKTPTVVSSKHNSEGKGDASKDVVGGPVKLALEDKSQSNSASKDSHPVLSESGSSSDISELGEIRNDSIKATRVAPQPVKPTVSKERGQPIEKSVRQTSAGSDIKSHPANKLDISSTNGANGGAGSTLTQSKPPASTHVSPTSPLASQHRDRAQSYKADQRRDRFERTYQNQESRKEHERERLRDVARREEDIEARWSSAYRNNVDDAERAIADRKRDVGVRRAETARATIDENARAAAEYKRELEVKSRRFETARAAANRDASTRNDNNKDVRGERPLQASRSTGVTSQSVAADSGSSVQVPEIESQDCAIPHEAAAAPEQGMTQNAADMNDWLQLTEYYDVNYRNRRLNTFRKLRALDLQRAELEREAQLEIEERSGIPRAQSALPREGTEAAASRSALPSRGLRTSSVLAMPPPALPLKDVQDDIGIKIKDSANREALSTTRPITDSAWSPGQFNEHSKPSTPTLKRQHAEDDLESRHTQPAEKLSRVDWDGRSSERRPQLSPANVKGEPLSFESRFSMDEGHSSKDHPARSRSPHLRRRSISPVPRRISGSDAHKRQHSGGSFNRNIGYSPVRRSSLSRPSSPSQREGREPFAEEGFRENIDSLRKYDAKLQDERDGRYSGDYHSWNNQRPPIAQYQQYIPNTYRGRGRGGKGAHPHASSRGGYKPYRSNGGIQDRESGGSVSLNLKAGDSRYFMIKSWNSENVEIAQRDCTWATQEKNLAVLTEAYKTCRNVILFFSINNSRAFQGYARMSSAPGDAPVPTWAKHLIWDATPPFHIRWITIAETRFNRVGHLKNALNEGQAVLVGRDGQEIEGSCGEALCGLIDEDGRGESEGDTGREGGRNWGWEGKLEGEERKGWELRLGKSGLKISKVVLGAMSYGDPDWQGWVLNEEESLPLLQHAYKVGINTWDTADVYSNGRSEEIIGKALRQFEIPRSKIVLLSKCYFGVEYGSQPGIAAVSKNDNKWVNRVGLSRKHILDAVDASVERLGTYIDVLQIHRLDRDTPREEIMRALNDVVESGKARYIGASSMAAWEFQSLQNIAAAHGWHKFISMQNYHNLVYREEEREMIPYCQDTGVGLLPWSPIARGVLARPFDDRSSNREKTDNFLQSMIRSRENEVDKEIVGRLEKVAKDRGVGMAMVATAWVLRRGENPIVGMGSKQRIDQAVEAVSFKLSDEEANSLEELYLPKQISGY